MLVRKTIVIVRGGVYIFLKTGCFDKAAAISFYAFFSLIPILLLTTVLLGMVLGTHEGLLDMVITESKKVLPYIGPRIITDLRGLSSAWSTFGWLSIVLLLFSAEFVLTAASDALQAVFDVPKRYGFFKKKVINILILLIPVAAALLSITITAVVKILGIFEIFDIFGPVLSYYLQSFMLTHVVPFAIMVIAVAVVYWIVSGPNLDFNYSFYGSILFTSVWEVAKQLFAWYISIVPTYNKFYGSIGTMMVLLLWMFFSTAIFLFSASVARAAFRGHSGEVI